MRAKFQTREWQEIAMTKAIDWWNTSGDRHFVINAAPGAGKTKAACLLAGRLIQADEIDRIVVIAPRNSIVRQWGKEITAILHRQSMKLTGRRNVDVEDIREDIVATWHGISGIKDVIADLCFEKRVLVIADEVHHGAVQEAWGTNAASAFIHAYRVLVLTGTPVRTDGERPVWMDGYSNHSLRERASHTVTYGEAIEEGWCVPATFHRHPGTMSVVSNGISLEVSNTGIRGLSSLPPEARTAVERMISFERLIKAPDYLPDGSFRPGSYHSTMLDWCHRKLEDLRSREIGNYGVPNAACLVVAPNIRMANYFRDLIKHIFPGEGVELVHSEEVGSDDAIDRFDGNDKRWLVSVNMVSEGVDIPRLRVLLYLPNSGTELTFRQTIARCIRKRDERDNSRAYVVMPELDDFVQFARIIEAEMEDRETREPGKPRAQGEGPFQDQDDTFWECESCHGLTSDTRSSCQHCGAPRYQYTLEAATGFRLGAICRGESVEEAEMVYADENTENIITMVTEANDPRLERLVAKHGIELVSVLERLVVERYRQRQAGKAA